MIVVMKTVLQFTGTGVRSGSFSFNIWRRETGKNGARGDEIKMTADLVRRIISFRRAGGGGVVGGGGIKRKMNLSRFKN